MAERHHYTLSNGQPIASTFKLDDVSSMALALSHCSGDCEACWSLLHFMVCGPGDFMRPDGVQGHAKETIDSFIRAGREK